MKNNGEDNSSEIAEGNIDTKDKRKPSRAQLRREKKANEMRRRAAACLEDEHNAQFSRGNIEKNEIERVLMARNLKVHDIPPDGDCLYNALSHQIHDFSGAELRNTAARFILENRMEFLPFLTNDDGDLVDEMGFEEYCNKVERTSQQGGTWGGEVELRAISNSLRRRIEVVQPDGRVIIFGEDLNDDHPLIITYHRYAYELGEHYNSTEPLSPAEL